MALNSPRFKNETLLKNVEAGRAVLMAGASGRHVHLVQMALIDLGFPMPISSASNHFAPDGIYGAETTAAVRAFQTRVGATLTADGKIGQNTLRELDRRIGGFSHRVNLHFRSLALSDVPFDRILSSAEQVYAQYGIEVRFASGESLGLSQADQDRFSTVGQNCVWDVTGGEFDELHNLGTPVPNTDIKVFIVNRFQEGDVLGCGGHAAGKPACAVTANSSRWDTAHEVCHVLLTSGFAPVHTDSRRNLMFAFSSNGREPLTLTDKQLTKIRANPLCRSIGPMPTMS